MIFFSSWLLSAKQQVVKFQTTLQLLTISLLLAFLTSACTVHSQENSPAADGKTATSKPVLLSKSENARSPVPVEQIDLQSFEDFKKTLQSRGEQLADQGILIESFDGNTQLAELNADTPFNPASVMKLATSLMALEKLTPAHRYRTNFLADGTVEISQHKLTGDLVVEGSADPMFSRTDAEQVAKSLAQIGISRVTGNLRIVEPFYFYARGYKSNLSRETSAVKLYESLRRAGLRIEGRITYGESKGTPLVAHYSDTLASILLYQNAHSSNAIAEVIGESIGGAEKIQEYLIQTLHLKEDEVYVGRPSGLEFNRLTPRASLIILRKLISTLEKYSLKPENILAVAGVDSSTLNGRFSKDEFRGSVIAKTGTLFTFDRGVSTLVGIAFTKARGELLFAVFNTDGRVHAFRNLQDEFIAKTIEESGGAAPHTRTEDALEEKPSGSIVQILAGKSEFSEQTK